MCAGVVLTDILAGDASTEFPLPLVPVVFGLNGVPSVGKFDGTLGNTPE